MICTGIPSRCQCAGRCPMLAAKARGDVAIPINNAARRQQGLPEDPNEPTGAGYEDYIVDKAINQLFPKGT